MPNVTLPPHVGGAANAQFLDLHSMVILGANGSGKSRLGAWIEENARENGRRISAQRALSIPLIIQPRAREEAERSLYYGRYEPNWDLATQKREKTTQRWKGNPTGHLLNDFEHLLELLFANERMRDREYTRAAKILTPTDKPQKSDLDRLLDIWMAVMPHRRIAVQDDKIVASESGRDSYAGRDMSDGERVTVYLIGQALCAPKDSIFIVDEPEIHIHKSIQAPLWDQIELARPDCSFVYLTHDLDFAATRIAAKKIWVKQYDGTNWEWDEIPADTNLPEPLLYQLLGSRRPVLFVEGEATSHDAEIYSALYPKELVIPQQSCETVIRSTKAMAALRSSGLHHLNARGIVDRDHRQEDEIASLRQKNLLVADVAEVENLMCLPEAVEAVAKRLIVKNSVEACAAAKLNVLGALQEDLESQSIARALAQIQFNLNGFGPKILKNFTAAKLAKEMQAYTSAINVGAIVDESKKLLEKVVADQDYLAALRYYNCKGIPAFVARALNIDKPVYVQVILGILKEDPDGTVARAMRAAIR